MKLLYISLLQVGLITACGPYGAQDLEAKLSPTKDFGGKSGCHGDITITNDDFSSNLKFSYNLKNCNPGKKAFRIVELGPNVDYRSEMEAANCEKGDVFYPFLNYGEDKYDLPWDEVIEVGRSGRASDTVGGKCFSFI